MRHLSGAAFATHLRTQDFSGQRVLDLGCGTGILAAALHDRGASVVATDIDPKATKCAMRNLRETDVDVRRGDLFDPVVNERFDVVVVNPPYEIGRARRPTLRSFDLLERLSRSWSEMASTLMIAFPTDAVDVLRSTGIMAPLVHRIDTEGRELGVFIAHSSRVELSL